MIKWIAQVTGLPFRRVQFIPDMLPSDLIGKDRIDPAALHQGSKDAVTWVNGPLFTSILLADEINRAPSKVQAALLEAMGENQITPFGKPSRAVFSPIHEAALNVWHRLVPDGSDNGWPKGLLGLPAIKPDRKDLVQFTAFATMNPIEQEGTYPLSEAQIDRFGFKVVVPYPSRHVYPDITGVVYSGNKPPEALDPQYSQADYEEYFEKNTEAMRPILGPIYFFLLCRGFVLPVKLEKQQKNVVKSMLEMNVNNENVEKIYDIVLMTNAKTPSTEGVAKRRPIYAEKEQVDLRAYINSLTLEQKVQKNKLLSILECDHCQYVLAGASPRGFFKLLAAALCEAFIRGQDFVEHEHIRAVVHAVLRHRVHMDVHARLENIESVDVLDAVCDKILDTN
jgi:MoxR-like ATPase